MLGIEVDFQDELTDALKILEPKLVGRAMRATLNRLARPILSGMQERAPKHTGVLAGSLVKRAVFRTGYARVYVGLRSNPPGWLVTRAKGAEYGNARMSARPYIAPTVAEHRNDTIDELREYLNKQISRQLKKSLRN